MDNPAGLETLGAMIDREYLATVPGITDQDYVQTMLAALTALLSRGFGNREAALDLLPSRMRGTTRVYSGEGMMAP